MHVHGGDIYTYQNMLDYSANINPLGIPQRIIDAVTEGAKRSAEYPDVQCRELRKALSQSENIPQEQIICGNGAADLIFSLVLAKRPKKALIIAPTFYEYEQALRAVGCEIQYYYLKEKKGFRLQEDYLDLLTEDIDIIFFCNPNNPTGLLSNKDFLTRVLKQCEDHDIFFVLDECFNDFLDEPEEYTMKEFLSQTHQLFILKAFTKLYAMAGLRLGYGLTSNGKLLKKMKEVTQPWSVSTPAQWAGIAALKETEYVAKTKKIIKEERNYLTKSIDALGMTTYGSMANYIFLKGPKDLHEECKKHQILIRDCSNYEGLTNGFYRIAVKDRNNNRRLIDVFKQCLKDLEGADQCKD
ncbi:MAG TPA: aminotransferase class I/II-fold pyridoxal phosphate-dependent enzyme [Firmicutes bacterium]|nr:aminotransferase class I/II-fold pyridoxal phosphate-dependent enzyme [Bacillota bacterium]